MELKLKTLFMLRQPTAVPGGRLKWAERMLCVQEAWAGAPAGPPCFTRSDPLAQSQHKTLSIARCGLYTKESKAAHSEF